VTFSTSLPSRHGRPWPAVGPPPTSSLIEDWYDLARQCGITVHDEHGDLRPDIDDAITRTVTAAIWFGITTGYLTLTGTYYIPRGLAGWR
jgi:hypothetical protein